MLREMAMVKQQRKEAEEGAKESKRQRDAHLRDRSLLQAQAKLANLAMDISDENGGVQSRGAGGYAASVL